MRKISSLLNRLTSSHKVVLGGALFLLLAVVVLALTGSTKAALAMLGLLSFAGLGITVVYMSVLSGRIARQEQRVLLQGQTVLARLAKDVYHSPPGEVMPQGRATVALDAGASWAHAVARSPKSLERFVNQAKKTRSFGSRNVLAYVATRGQMDWRALQMLLTAHRLNPDDQNVRNAAKGLWVPGARALARVLFCQRTREDDLHNSLALYEVIEEQQGRSVLEPIDCSYLSDLLVTFARQAEVGGVLDHQQEMTTSRQLSQALLQVNAANPFIAGAVCTEAEWLGELNAQLAIGGLAPVRLAEGNEPAFYRLHGVVAPLQQNTLPLVTVIMPIYEPDRSTAAAVDSLLAQTWINLEILMVDDGSPAVDEDGHPTGYRTFLAELAGRDPRIRLILNEENRGAYWARNVAYAAARGKYVTVADKDDWHHPQKIQLQAQDLERHPERLANMVQWARVDEDLRFLFRWGPDRIIHPSFASIMYRREEVQAKLGYWDNVRKSADNEFRMRFQVAYGTKITSLGELPLAFSLLGDGNLTSRDFGLGFEQPERRIYRQSYESWHSEIASSNEPPYLPIHPPSRRFQAPATFLPARLTEAKFDVIYVSAYEYSEQESEALAEEMAAAVALGIKVGVISAESYLDDLISDSQGQAKIQKMLNSGEVEQVTLGQRARALTVLIRDPLIFQVTRDTPGNLDADRVLIRAEIAPVDHETGFRRYDVGTVEETIQTVLHKLPEWLVQSDSVRSELVRLVPPARIVERWEARTQMLINSRGMYE